MSRNISCSILTPERSLYEGEVGFVVVQAFDGEVGFLFNHAPLISELGIGEVRLRKSDSTNYFVIEGGIVEIRENKMIILAENAYKKEELNQQQIESRLKEIDENDLPQFSKERLIIKIEEEKLKVRLKVVKK